jgi:hypothetical protein
MQFAKLHVGELDERKNDGYFLSRAESTVNACICPGGEHATDPLCGLTTPPSMN